MSSSRPATVTSTGTPTTSIAADSVSTDSSSNRTLVYVAVGISAVLVGAIASVLLSCWLKRRRKLKAQLSERSQPPNAEVGHPNGSTKSAIKEESLEANDDAAFMVSLTEADNLGMENNVLSNTPSSDGERTLPSSSPTLRTPTMEQSAFASDSWTREEASTSTIRSTGTAKSLLKNSASMDDLSNVGRTSRSIASNRHSMHRVSSDIMLQYHRSYNRAAASGKSPVMKSPITTSNAAALEALWLRSKRTAFSDAFNERASEVLASSEVRSEGSINSSVAATNHCANDEKLVQFAQSFNKRYSSAYNSIDAAEEEAVQASGDGTTMLTQTSYWFSEPAAMKMNTDSEGEAYSEVESDDFSSNAGSEYLQKQSSRLSMHATTGAFKTGSTRSRASYYWSSAEYSAQWDSESSQLEGAEYTQAWHAFLRSNPDALTFHTKAR
ncbi:hypothetical protein HDU78_005819 [Chytriomyces hyalinus]|nr:hypothetical protein HDU78_005819 [Chytriomyces hyalinus]